MAIEFIGNFTSVCSEEAGPRSGHSSSDRTADVCHTGEPGRARDADYPLQAAALDEEAGFDKLLIGYEPGAPDGLLVANEVLTTTSRLGVVIAQVPGLVAPTVAARQYATLAAFHRARVGMHALTEAGAVSAPDDGAAREPAAAYRRAAEFLDVVRMCWDAAEPFDYGGEFYQVAGATAPVSAAGAGLPVYCSGESAQAVRLGAAHADVYVLAGAAVPATARRLAALQAMAAAHGRRPRIAMSVRLSASPAGRVCVELRGGDLRGCDRVSWVPPANVGLAAGGRLRMIGEYDQIAEVLAEYEEIGVSALVIGHDPLADASACAEVIAQLRAA